MSRSGDTKVYLETTLPNCQLELWSIIDFDKFHKWPCGKCRHNTFRDAFAQMFDRLKKSATPSAVNILDVQTEPRYLLPSSDLASKKPADVFLKPARRHLSSSELFLIQQK